MDELQELMFSSFQKTLTIMCQDFIKEHGRIPNKQELDTLADVAFFMTVDKTLDIVQKVARPKEFDKCK